MLELIYINGEVFVFNADDWIVLRKTHRIMGELLRNSKNIPSLPCKLLIEDALLLQEKQLAIIVERDYKLTEEDKRLHEELEDKLLAEEIEIHKNTRKRQLEGIIDKIVEAKRKLGDDRTEEDIFKEELNKSFSITRDTMIWPIFLQPLGKPTYCSKTPLLNNTSKCKYHVYKDLWERGYYITSGIKFGGDFLVYLGDPIVYHAIFIIRCVDNSEQPIDPSEIIAFGRLGTSVRKRAVFASLQKDKISYLTINWIDA